MMYSTKEASEYIGISANHLRKLVREGLIQAFDISFSDKRATYKFRKEDLDEWMKSRMLLRTPLPEARVWRSKGVR